MTQLIITADDYGYAPCVDAGIVEAAREGLIDAVAVMVDREPAIEELRGCGVDLGLHLELAGDSDSPRAGDAEREEAGEEIRRQLDAFEALVDTAPAFLNGHHHCHARPGLGVLLSGIANEHSTAVRSVSSRHRRLLRCRGVRTPELLIGRFDQEGPAEPDLAGLETEAGVVEWMVHPGRGCADLDSRYAEGRDEDLRLLREIKPPAGLSRTTFSEAI